MARDNGLIFEKLKEQRGKSSSLRLKGKREYMYCIINLISQRMNSGLARVLDVQHNVGYNNYL